MAKRVNFKINAKLQMPGNTGIFFTLYTHMSDDFKNLDQNNTSILYLYLSDGYESFIEWFGEQRPERQEYVLELMSNMITELNSTKTKCYNKLHEPVKNSAQVIPLRRKPKFTVIK